MFSYEKAYVHQPIVAIEATFGNYAIVYMGVPSFEVETMNDVTYAAFFYGINVGGKNKVGMNDLKQMFIDVGMEDVSTYIQSGNVVFRSKMEPFDISNIIETAFKERFGFERTVMIRSSTDVDMMIKDLPFAEENIARVEKQRPDVEHVHFFMSNADIPVDTIEPLLNKPFGNDLLAMKGQNIFLLSEGGFSDSKTALSVSKLKIPLTSRNLKTMLKIREMLFR